MGDVYIPSTWRRLVAQGIDVFIRLPFYLPFGKIFLTLLFTEDEVRISLTQFFVLLFIPAVYDFIFLLLMQATPGKWILGLSVVPCHQPEAELHWHQCLLRPLTERLSLFVSWAFYATAFFRYDRTHIADWVAETRVVQFHRRSHLPRVRWFIGGVLIFCNLQQGLRSARNVLQKIDWENHQVDLRSMTGHDMWSDWMDKEEDED